MLRSDFILRADVENADKESLIEVFQHLKEGDRFKVHLRNWDKIDTGQLQGFIFLKYVPESEIVLVKKRANSKNQEWLSLNEVASVYRFSGNKGQWHIPLIKNHMYFARIIKMYDGIEDILSVVFEAPASQGNDEQIVYEYSRTFYESDEDEDDVSELAASLPERPDVGTQFTTDDLTTAWHVDRWERLTVEEYLRLYDLLYQHKY